MKDKKIYIFLLLVIITFGVAMLVFIGMPNVTQKKYSSTLLVGDNTIWSFNGEKWLNITYDSTINKLNWNTFNVYSDSKFIGKYQLWHDDKWYAFDKNKDAVNINGRLFAYKSNYDINILKFNSENIDADDYVYQVLSNNDISVSSKFTVLTKTLVDIDNDGEDEAFYIVSNSFPEDFNPSRFFSFVFMVKDNKIYDIYDDINTDYYDACKPYFSEFLDADGDGQNEFILSCGGYSAEGEINMLYGYNEDGFKIIISNR